ncbi:hypothetical protein V8Z74_14960 [Comamonas sp. w2-DMI]|uniref:hypothetical protein n=1 Tax=Comamonas sp. w2-DMI TaxID=3126391 RepID=UPI0032E48DF4
MKRRLVKDDRQMGFAFCFEPAVLHGAAVETRSDPVRMIDVPVPRVLDSASLTPPEKVKSVFELFFSKEPLDLLVRNGQQNTSNERKFNPKDFPDQGKSKFDWTDDDIVKMHQGVLDTHLEVFASRPPSSREKKLEALDWIFSEPVIHAYKKGFVLGRQVDKPILTSNIPFTFYCACRLTGCDPEAIQAFVEANLQSTGDLDLLDRL